MPKELPKTRMRVDASTLTASTLAQPQPYPTEQARRIMEQHLPKWRELFLQRNADYGDNADYLGAAGQFADIWRKIRKLKKGMWDGEPLTGEQIDEILLDLIGHCFLSLDMLENDNRKGTL